MWAKIPAATASIACAACIAAASVAVPVMQSSESLVKTISSEVNLSAINFGALDWLSAIPQYEALITGDTEAQLAALGELDLLNGIPGYLALLGGDFSGLSSVDGVTAWVDFVQSGGDLHSFTTIEDDPTTPNVDETQAGYAALNGTEAWQNFLTTGDLSADGLGGIDAFSAIPAYATLLDSEATQDEKDDALESLDLVSAIPSIRDGDLSGLDSLNAIPAYQTAFDSSKSPGTRADALRSLDLISAIPEYLGLPTAKEEAEEEADAAPLAAKVAAPETTATEEEPQTTTPLKQLSQTITQSLPQANVQAPAAPAAEGAQGVDEHIEHQDQAGGRRAACWHFQGWRVVLGQLQAGADRPVR
ncbi:hypothetical protein [Mycolicibacterium mageritense]|uniref:hypothetical protein n=1 Tax=Mycolicibacterium mageritense TaxID=53462 RepID=UPI001E4323AA|nr:hypothetical protein [Mycolicibacterium mageritense]MCC9181980.1 hypothetical protein [Mycolicibacterium mageritense]